MNLSQQCRCSRHCASRTLPPASSRLPTLHAPPTTQRDLPRQQQHGQVSTQAFQQTSGEATTSTATAQASSPTPGPAARQRISALKMRLLSAVASLDRGLAANGRDAREVEELVRVMEAAAGPVTLAWGQPAQDGQLSSLDMLQGTWRLLYTSGFNTGSLGGRRPGPPAAIVPSTLGQVYQRIDAQSARLDNIVEFLLVSPLPSLSNLLGSLPSSLAASLPLPVVPSSSDDYPETPAVRLTLKHSYELKGTNTVEIVFEDTSAELVGAPMLAQLPLKFDVPQLPDALKPPRNFRSATFEVVFLDSQMRITRGDRKELRIYVRDVTASGLEEAAEEMDE